MRYLVILFMFIGTVAVADTIQFKIVPETSSYDLERRVRQLEYAVQELQMRVFNLQMGADKKPTPVPEPKNFVCEIKAFSQVYREFGPTMEEAKEKARQACVQKHHAMHCDVDTAKCNPNK
ncbi:MAG: hypothetical protein HY072_09300 [Deltaproteobacteria bacterium]|nr:hypothetical protein [Deltaproteobacteria bacterium]